MTKPRNSPKKSRRLRKPGPGVLVLLAGFLFASGLVRIGDGTGVAIARELGSWVNSAHASPPRTVEATPGFDELLSAVRARETRVAEVEAKLAERERALAVAQNEINRGLEELAAAEQNLRDLLTIADTAAEEDIVRLTAMYETMKPADAAALFEEMEPSFAAGFLGRMRPDAAGAVLAGLPPDKAYTLSVVLAGRNAAVVTE